MAMHAYTPKPVRAWTCRTFLIGLSISPGFPSHPPKNEKEDDKGEWKYACMYVNKHGVSRFWIRNAQYLHSQSVKKTYISGSNCKDDNYTCFVCRINVYIVE